MALRILSVMTRTVKALHRDRAYAHRVVPIIAFLVGLNILWLNLSRNRTPSKPENIAETWCCQGCLQNGFRNGRPRRGSV